MSEAPSLIDDDTNRRLVLRIAWLVIGLSALYELGYMVIWAQRTDGANDFFIFWSAAHWIVERGLTAPLYDLDVFHNYQENIFGWTGPYHPLPYPPTLAPLLIPLASWPLLTDYTVCMAATLALFLALTSTGHKIRAIALLSSPATLAVLVVGQIAFLSSALLLGGLRQVGRRPLLGGALLGLLTIKPQLGLLVPVALIAFRAWRAVAAATVVALLIPLPSFLFAGWDVWAAWLHLMPVIARFLAYGPDSSVGQMVSPAAALIVVGVPLQLAELIQIPISIAIAAVTYVACRRHGPTDMVVAMVGVGTLLVTPYAWFYDLLFSAFAAVVLAEAGLRTGFRQWELPALVLVWVLPLFAIGEVMPGLATLSLLALYVLLLRRMGEAPATTAEQASHDTGNGVPGLA